MLVRVGIWDYIAESDGVAPAKARGPFVAPPAEISEIVTVSVDPPSEIVSVIVELSPLVEVVGKSVAMLDSEDKVEVVDVLFVVLEGRGLELDVDVVVRVVRGELDLKVAGGPIGNVMFRAVHPEDTVSRRLGTGHSISRESMPFQTTAGCMVSR